MCHTLYTVILIGLYMDGWEFRRTFGTWNHHGSSDNTSMMESRPMKKDSEILVLTLKLLK
jgi:hypothetical protein